MSVHPLSQLLLRVLLAAAPQLDASAIEELIALRVSAESLKKLATHFAEGLRIYEHHAIVGPWWRSLPEGLFDDPDETVRLRHGIHRVEIGHIHDGVERTKRVGYVALAHHHGRAVLLLFVHHTASEADVHTVHGPKNSWAELIVGCWEWATECRILRFSHDDRMNRSTAVWVRINDAVKARPGGRYCLADIEVDPHSDSWQGIILGQKAAEEVEVGKIRRIAGKLTKLTSNAWPRGYVPVGLRLGLVEDNRGELQPDKSAGLEADPGQTAELTAVLKQYANGVSKALIASDQARKGARDGAGALLLPRIVPLLDETERKKVLSELPALLETGAITPTEQSWVDKALAEPTNPERRVTATQTGVTYVDRILAARRHLRSGELHVLTFGAIAGRTEYHGWRPTFVTASTTSRPWAETISESELGDDHPYWQLEEHKQLKARTHGFWHTPLQVGTPVQLPDATWAAIEHRIHGAKSDMERRTVTGQRRPLGGLRWPGDNGSFRIGQGGERETYVITGPDGTHLHTINATQAAKSFGELLLQLVDRVDAAPLPLLQPAEDSVQTRIGLIQQRIQELETELSETEKKMSGLMDKHASTPENSRRYRLAMKTFNNLEARADMIEHTTLPALRGKLQRASAQTDEPEFEETDADFAHLAVTAAALLRCDPLGPAAVRDAVSWLLDHGRGLSNLRTGEHGRQILIDVSVRIPLADGTIGRIDAGTLDLTERRLSATRKAELVEDAARRLLRDGEPIEALAARYDRSNADLLVGTAGWLAKHTTLNTYLRAAVVTAAAAGGGLPVGPVVYAHATDDATALQRLRDDAGNWIVDQIELAYLRTGATWAKNSGWVRSPLDASRTAMSSIAQDGQARRQTLIGCIDGLRNDEQLKDLLHSGRRSFWQPPLQLEDGWIDAYVCRAADCPGGGTAPMTGFLPVPELVITDDAVYCRHCWRTLTRHGVLPAAYRVMWDVGTDTSALRRADGVPFVAKPPSAPTRGINVLRARDVAEALGLPIHRVQNLVKDGQIPASRTAGGKLVFDADRALSPSVRRRFATKEVPSDAADERRLSLQSAAQLLSTTPITVRMLSRTGAITNIGGTGGALYDRTELERLLADIRSQTGQLTATMARLATLSDLAAEWGVHAGKVRRLVSQGVLDGVTVGTVVFVDRRSIDRLEQRQLRALDPTIRMTTEQVAERAGIHTSTVLHHHATKSLCGVQLTPDGTVWFLPEEVDDWLASRTASVTRNTPLAGGAEAASSDVTNEVRPSPGTRTIGVPD